MALLTLECSTEGNADVPELTGDLKRPNTADFMTLVVTKNALAIEYSMTVKITDVVEIGVILYSAPITHPEDKITKHLAANDQQSSDVLCMVYYTDAILQLR